MTSKNTSLITWSAACLLLSIPGLALSAAYTYELSQTQPWTEGGTSETNTEYVNVRTYVPGSKSLTYNTIPIYTPTYTSESNSVGDIVGSVYQVYGSGTTAFVKPYDLPKRTVVYPATQILHTELLAINDSRLAIGNYNVLGGHAAGRGFIYDVIFDQYTELVAPNTVWTDLNDINNNGQIVGTSINADGAVRKGFVYDCENGFQTIDVPGSSWTVPRKIDDEGNVYGTVSGIAETTYFIARPDASSVYISCSLVPRDDIATPIYFNGNMSFELSGDYALGVKIADFDGRGVNDFLIYHEPGKTILYLGEEKYNEKIKYSGDEFNTLAESVDLETAWDFNNDGYVDKVENNGFSNHLFFSKGDGSFYYVPQELPSGTLYFGDMNADGLIDFTSFSGGYASITYQSVQPEEIPLPDTDPAPDSVPESASIDEAPAIDPNAKKVERTATIVEVHDTNLLLSSGEVLWINSDTVVKYNDTSGFKPGQKLEFKAWKNPGDILIGMKIEVI